MGEKKRAKKQSRTKLEICKENAEKFVTKTENYLKSANDLKDKINALPGGSDFSKMAIGFNNLITEINNTLPLPFATTEKEETVSVTTDKKTFTDYQKMKSKPEPQEETDKPEAEPQEETGEEN